MAKKQKSNSCGITGLALGWAFPIVGLVLGIVALGRGEPNKTLGTLSIIESVLFWILWMAVMFS
jgi:hypothetical protein